MTSFSALARRLAFELYMMSNLERLPIDRCWVDEEGHARVSLVDGTHFAGYANTRRFRRVARSLPSGLRRDIPAECVDLAVDVFIRYFVGALQFPFPYKQSRYVVGARDTVLELGAMYGIYTLRLARQASEGTVVAVEAGASNCQLLQKNLRLNDCQHVEVVNAAIWDSDGFVDFGHLEGDMQSGSAVLARQDSVQVESVTIASLAKRFEISDVDFLIVQLNGAEARAITGLEDLRPANLSIAARYEPGNSVSKLEESLLSLGYRVQTEPGGFLFASFAE